MNMMEEALFLYWHWWAIAAISLFIIEALSTTGLFLWLGISAMITAFMTNMFTGFEWQYQMFMFAVMSVASAVIWKRIRKSPPPTDQPHLNSRGASYVGRVLTLTSPIKDGNGKTAIDDSIWRVMGEDCDIGTKVKVTSVVNTTLMVEAV